MAMAKETTTYRIFENINEVDISEQDIYDYDPTVLDQLLIDHTMSAKARAEADDYKKVVNIFWATNDYAYDEETGEEKEGFRYDDEIKPENITHQNGRVIMPRVLKDKKLQSGRTKDKAEVFTPSWVCNAQNNLVDEAWFGRKDVFNREVTGEDGSHSWIPTEGKIEFPDNDKQKTWQKYVSENRMEITCGEAPYIASRYDTTTGEAIPIQRRIGLLDRKFRVINENVTTEKEWYYRAEQAVKHTYGYEWQGDNLLLAREAVLYTYIEYFIDKFNPKDEQGHYIRNEQGKLNVPTLNMIKNAARWISWNLWQMDGIRMVVPDSCSKAVSKPDLFGEVRPKECKACKNGEIFGDHIGVQCYIRDWDIKKKPKDWKPRKGEDPKSKPWQKIEFRSLVFGRGLHNDEEESDNE